MHLGFRLTSNSIGNLEPQCFHICPVWMIRQQFFCLEPNARQLFRSAGLKQTTTKMLDDLGHLGIVLGSAGLRSTTFEKL